MEIQLILVACIVNFGSLVVQSQNYQTGNQGATTPVNDGSNLQANFQNLFDSIGNNDEKRSRIYREVLRQEIAGERDAYDAVKHEIHQVQNRNSDKRRHFYNKGYMDGHIKAVKREANQDEKRTSQMIANRSATTRTYTFAWEAPTESSNSVEDEDPDFLKVSPELLSHFACNLTREVLDLQREFLDGVADNFEKMKKKNQIKWAYKFEGILDNCELIIEHDQDEIKDRLRGRKDGLTPGIAYNPLRPASISNLVHNYNHIRVLIEEDENLKDIDEQFFWIRRLLDDAEAELHRFNWRVRNVMKRIDKILSSTVATSDSSIQTTPMTTA